MKLKSLYQIPLLLMFAVVVFFTGCDDDDEKAAPTMGEVTFDRDKIGLDQLVVSFCYVPQGSLGVTESGCFFSLNGGEMQQAEISSGRITGTFRTTVPGANTIVFNVTTTEGVIEATGVFNVEACDVRNSFWNESIYWSSVNCPELTKSSNNNYVAFFTQDYLSSFQNMPLTVNYYFTSSLLTKVTEVSEVKFDTGSEGDYYAVYSSIKSSLSTTYGSSITEYEYITSTGTEEGLLPYDQENAAYAQQIGEAVFNGQAKLHCEFESGTTLVVFEAYKNVSTGRVAFFRTYEPRG